VADVWTVAKRLLAGDRRCFLFLLTAVVLAACGSSEPPHVPEVSGAEPRPTATREEPPQAVTIVPLTSVPADVVRPGEPGALEGELTDATAEPGRCPDPFPEDHELRGSETVRLPQAEEVAPPQRLQYESIVREKGLEEAILDLLGDNEERHAVIIKDLSSGRGVAINAERLFYAASLFKLQVLFEAFHQREQGLIDFGERYIASDYYAEFGLGPHLIEQCDEVTVGRLLEAMMSVSDNVAAVMLQDRVGPRHINASMTALGLEVTGLFPDALPITGADVALLMEAIARGEAVGEQASKEMTDLLAMEKVDDRIPAALPDGVPVAHKTGNWENATHDAGIVYGERSTYVFVLLSDIGFDGDAGAVQRDVVRAAWEWFEGSGPEAAVAPAARID
jgi:beta-lactamase class A